MPAKNAREVKVTENGESTTLWLEPKVFEALRLFDDGRHEILHHERQFAELRKLGLATHKFTAGDWPKALGVLTDKGRQALRQDPVYQAGIA